MEGELFEAVELARKLASNNSINESILQYIRVIITWPQLRTELKTEFLAVIVKSSEISLSESGQDIFTNLKIALDIYPGDSDILNELGWNLCKFGYKYEGFRYLEKAIYANVLSVGIERNLNKVKRSLFLPDIFRIINDRRKNEAYRKAINETIDPQFDCVIETNSGSGVLLLYIGECLPSSGILSEDSMVKEEWVKYMLFYNDEPLVFNNRSRLTNNEVMLRGVPGMHNLWITDMFHSGLIDNYLLSTLSKALRAPLAKSVRVLPKRAEYFVIGVTSENLMADCHLMSLHDVLLTQTNYVHLTADIKGAIYEQDIRTYTDLEYVTEPVMLLSVDFNDYNNLNKLLTTSTIKTNIKAIEDTKISTLVGWFNLYLTDEVMITTNPTSKERIESWKNVVYYDFFPTELRENEIKEVEFKILDGALHFVPEDKYAITRISRNMLKFLNDKDYIENLITYVESIWELMDITEACVIDFCPFPVFGLTMLNHGAKSLVINPKNYEDDNFIKSVFVNQKVKLDKVTTLIGEQWSLTDLENIKYNVIFSNIFNYDGQINMFHYGMWHQLKENYLADDGLFIPTKISVIAMLASSQELSWSNRADDENVGFNVETHLSKYQITEVAGVAIEYLLNNSRSMSKPFTVVDDLFKISQDISQVRVTKSGKIDAILCWYDMNLTEVVEFDTYSQDSFVQNIAFLNYPPVYVAEGDTVNILVCVDNDKTFKLVFTGPTSPSKSED